MCILTAYHKPSVALVVLLIRSFYHNIAIVNENIADIIKAAYWWNKKWNVLVIQLCRWLYNRKSLVQFIITSVNKRLGCLLRHTYSWSSSRVD